MITYASGLSATIDSASLVRGELHVVEHRGFGRNRPALLFPRGRRTRSRCLRRTRHYERRLIRQRRYRPLPPWRRRVALDASDRAEHVSVVRELRDLRAGRGQRSAASSREQKKPNGLTRIDQAPARQVEPPETARCGLCSGRLRESSTLASTVMSAPASSSAAEACSMATFAPSACGTRTRWSPVWGPGLDIPNDPPIRPHGVPLLPSSSSSPQATTPNESAAMRRSKPT